MASEASDKRAVAPAARPRAGDDAEERTDPEGQRRRQAHQDERVGQPLENDVEHRPLEGGRPAKIAAQQRRAVGKEALQRPAIQAPLGAQLGGAAGIRAADARRHRRRRHRRAPPPAGESRRSPRSAAAAPCRSDAAAGDGECVARGFDLSLSYPGRASRRDAPPSDSKQRARTSLPARYAWTHVSAQFETAQRGLLETFCTLSLATVMKLNSATLIRATSPTTAFWNSL